MFEASYFPNTYFPHTYFTEHSAIPVPATGKARAFATSVEDMNSSAPRIYSLNPNPFAPLT